MFNNGLDHHRPSHYPKHVLEEHMIKHRKWKSFGHICPTNQSWQAYTRLVQRSNNHCSRHRRCDCFLTVHLQQRLYSYLVQVPLVLAFVHHSFKKLGFSLGETINICSKHMGSCRHSLTHTSTRPSCNPLRSTSRTRLIVSLMMVTMETLINESRRETIKLNPYPNVIQRHALNRSKTVKVVEHNVSHGNAQKSFSSHVWCHLLTYLSEGERKPPLWSFLDIKCPHSTSRHSWMSGVEGLASVQLLNIYW